MSQSESLFSPLHTFTPDETLVVPAQELMALRQAIYPVLQGPPGYSEPSDVAVRINRIGPHRIDVIKVLRRFIGMGLKEIVAALEHLAYRG